jgi:Arm DNA-binding domain
LPQEITSLSDAALRSLKPTGARYEITDKVARGLIGRVSSSGRVTFILRARDAGGTVKTVTLGTYPDMSLKAAREAASKARLDLKSGRNVNAEKKAVREIALTEQDKTTLHTIVLEYEQRFAPTKVSWRQRGPKTERSGARQVIERVYAPLLVRPIIKITDEDFARAVMGYKRLRPTDGRLTANGQPLTSLSRECIGQVLPTA